MNPMFSRKMVFELEAVVQDKAHKVCRLMQEGIKKGAAVDLHHAFRSVSVDVISDFAFDKSYNLLEKEDVGAYFFRMVRGLGPAMYVFQQFPSFQAVALSTPPWLAPFLSEALGCVTGFQQDCAKQAQVVKRRMAEGKLGDRQTIFSTLLSKEDKPGGYQTPSDEVLMQEAYSILAAAADTTGNAMTVAAFNVLSNPLIYQRLVQDLEEAFPDPNATLEFVELEKMPYLVHLLNCSCCIASNTDTIDRHYQRSTPPLLWRPWTPTSRRSRTRSNVQRLLRARRHDCWNVVVVNTSQPGDLSQPHEF